MLAAALSYTIRSDARNRKMVIRRNQKETGLHNYLYDVNYN